MMRVLERTPLHKRERQRQLCSSPNFKVDEHITSLFCNNTIASIYLHVIPLSSPLHHHDHHCLLSQDEFLSKSL